MQRLILSVEWSPMAIAALAVVIGMPPAVAQRITDQSVRQHLANPNTMSVLAKTVASAERGKTISVDGWRVIKTGPTKAVGMHDDTGVVAAFDADPNNDGLTTDSTLVLMQSFEYICPKDIAENPRWQRESITPSFDVVATAIVQGDKVAVEQKSKIVQFKPGSEIDVLMCHSSKP